MILAGDIGGTNTRLALFEPSGELKIAVLKKYPSRSHKGLEEIIRLFLDEQKISVRIACFGIAGPIREGVIYPPNLPWRIESSELSNNLHIPKIYLLNDLQANAYGIKHLTSNELFEIQEGKPQKGNQALISPGTGLGEGALYWDGTKHHPFACEGGHVDFAPRNALEIDLFLYLQKKYGHVSYERVVSGPGIRNLYEFMTEKRSESPTQEVLEAMKERDITIVISEFGLADKDKVCTYVIDWFLSLLGAEAGNLALKMLSLGGLFLGGGIPPRYAQRFKQSEFLFSFRNKGRFQELLESIPIYIIMNDNTALLGAASFAREQGY